MMGLSQFGGSRLEWIQPKTFERYFELRSEDLLLGTLTFRSALGTLAVAETAEGQWTFKRVGFLNPRVTVRVAGEEVDLAVYHPKFWGDGVLEFIDGRSIAWKPANFWATDWAFSDVEGRLLLRLSAGRERERLSEIFKTQATVDVEAPELLGELLPLLVAAGFYLLILRQQDAGAAAASGAAVS